LGRCAARWKIVLLSLTAMLGLAWSAVYAQQEPDLAGDYAGVIGTQNANLHLRVDANGALRGSIDHLDPPDPWMLLLAEIHMNRQALSFAIPSVNATWSGTISSNGESLGGIWTEKQGSQFVDFARQKFVPAATPSPVDGIWLGEYMVHDTTARIQVVVRSDIAGREFCTADLLDMHFMVAQCANVVFMDGGFSFDIPIVRVHWSGKLSGDGKVLAGSTGEYVLTRDSTQHIELPQNFTRQTSLSPEKPIPADTYDAAMPPVAAADLQSVLDRDLASALSNGELAPQTGAGVSIAVYEHGVRRVFSYGAAKPDSIFEIGSLTKTFTGLTLSQMAVQGKVKLDEPVRELLPAGTVAKPAGPEITLLDLATQRSGLPSMPDNIDLADMENPYADYHTADLLTYIRKHGVANPNHTSSFSGSLGFGLLGVALANRAGTSYAALLKEEVTDPLGLTDTTTTLSAEQKLRFLPGHDQFHGAAKAWDSDALSGALAIRSTADDMLTYLVANLHPENLKPVAGSMGAASLPAALRQSLQPQSEIVSGRDIALAWQYQKETGSYWHSGATAAFSSYAFFNRKNDYAAVVLLNTSPGVNGWFVVLLAKHISQRLEGKPAISLAP
jgi:CubicO group peptidase (beta-lactamase class C family)